MIIQSDALAGLNRAQMKLSKVAHSVATEGSSISDSNIKMINSENHFKANSKIVSAENEMLGTVLDLKA